jgi:hypothetical protein
MSPRRRSARLRAAVLLGCLAAAPVRADDRPCPYQPRQAAGPDTCAGWNRGVLDNLRNLEKARLLSKQAELDLARGRPGQACLCYEEVQRLCPGSRFDREAAARLHALHTAWAAAPDVGDAEEQESPEAWKPRPAEAIPAPRCVPQDGNCVLYVPARARSATELVGRVEGTGAAEEEQDAAPAAARSLCDVARQVLQALDANVCAESAGPRLRCNVQVGGAQLLFTWGKDGRAAVRLELTAGPTKSK